MVASFGWGNVERTCGEGQAVGGELFAKDVAGFAARRRHEEKPADVLSVGQEVTAKIVDFNEADKKISLSIKAKLAAEAKAVKEEEDAEVVSVDIDAVIAAEDAE